MPGCEDLEELPTAGGWKRHMHAKHGGYTETQSRESGTTGSSEHLKSMSGFSSLEDAKAVAPSTESEGSDRTTSGKSKQTRTPRLSSEEAKTQALKQLFEQNKPIHIRRWERKMRIESQIGVMIGGTPWTDEEIREGAEIHYELCVIMEWFTYSKYEVIIDVAFFHLKQAVTHTPALQAMVLAFKGEGQREQLTPMEEAVITN
jgi:hypothetical protein